MATREEWNRLINKDHELALIEYEMRNAAQFASQRVKEWVTPVLYRYFGAY